MATSAELLANCNFPPPGTSVNIAVSGGADSVGLTLLAVDAELRVTLHHVDHHVRDTSGEDAQLVRDLGARYDVPVIVHDVEVARGGNFEASARAQRRRVLPPGALTGHTMDDLAETILINLLRGAGLDGLSPMVDDPSKPLLHVRRADVRAFVIASGQPFSDDVTNDDTSLLRNRLRHETLPILNDTSQRDIVPVLARMARVVRDDRSWLDDSAATLYERGLGEVDCRELVTWPPALTRRWLRFHLRSADTGDGTHPPSTDEIERVLEVVRGARVATELSGGRRVHRQHQHLRVEQV